VYDRARSVRSTAVFEQAKKGAKKGVRIGTVGGKGGGYGGGMGGFDTSKLRRLPKASLSICDSRYGHDLGDTEQVEC